MEMFLILILFVAGLIDTKYTLKDNKKEFSILWGAMLISYAILMAHNGL